MNFTHYRFIIMQIEKKDKFEKLDCSIEAIEQLDKLRDLCLYLYNYKHVKKSGNKRIKPLPLFSKDAGSNGQIESIDIATGNAFLAGKVLTPASAKKLMNWIGSNFPWVLATRQELLKEAQQCWTKLVENEKYQHAFMHFHLLSDQGIKCIDIKALQQSAYNSLPKINIKESFYLELSGSTGDAFFIVLESFNEDKIILQLAPLIPPQLFPRNSFTSTIQPNETLLRYPLKVNLPFSEDFGLGRWSCIAIRSASISMVAKAMEAALLLTAQELAEFTSCLLRQNDKFVIDRYDFILIEK